MACFLVPLHRMLALGLNRWRRSLELIPHSIWCRRESEAEFRCAFKHGGGAFAFRLGFQRCREAVSIGQLNWSTSTITVALIFGACDTNHWRFCVKIPFPKKTNYALTFEKNGSCRRRHQKLVPLPGSFVFLPQKCRLFQRTDANPVKEPNQFSVPRCSRGMERCLPILVGHVMNVGTAREDDFRALQKSTCTGRARRARQRSQKFATAGCSKTPVVGRRTSSGRRKQLWQ